MQELQDLSPGTRQAQAFEALHQRVLQSSEAQPLMVENLQWRDVTSAGCLSELIERLGAYKAFGPRSR